MLCQSHFLDMYLILEVFQEMKCRKQWQSPISFYSRVSCFGCVSDKVVHFCLLPCSQKMPVLIYHFWGIILKPPTPTYKAKL